MGSVGPARCSRPKEGAGHEIARIGLCPTVFDGRLPPGRDVHLVDLGSTSGGRLRRNGNTREAFVAVG